MENGDERDRLSVFPVRREQCGCCEHCRRPTWWHPWASRWTFRVGHSSWLRDAPVV